MATRSLSLLLLLLISIIAFHQEAKAQPTLLNKFCINDRGNYTNSSVYKANLDTILSDLPSTNGNGYGFFNLSAGEEGNDRVYVIRLCRGDVGPDECRSCLQDAAQEVPRVCPNQKEAVGWYDFCMLRYSNRTLAGRWENSQRFLLVNPNNASSPDVFFQVLRTLLDGLKNGVASGGSLQKFRTRNQTGPDFSTIYALVQCSPDLSQQDCNNCLDSAFGLIRQCCSSKVGGRVVGPSCNFRFETNLFYTLTPNAPPEALQPSPPPALSLPLTPPPSNATTVPGDGSNTSRTVAIASVTSAVVVVLFIFACVYLRTKRKKKNSIQTRPLYEPVEEIESAESLQYSFENIRAATDDFSEENKLGQGGFGPVYKGRLSNGQEIAVKRLSSGSGQGDLEFKNEVMLVAKLQHRNLVRLLGFCLEGSERLLIYEFVPNASLDHFIFDPRKKADLDWDRRYKIIGGISRGILYLHKDSRLRIIHRDLKASNILLDEEMHPKISDFGMARLFHVDQTQANTSRIVGTYGYMAPEYAMHGQFSIKSDVYSFGVLILEIVSGQKNNCFCTDDGVEDLLSYAWRNWRDGTGLNVVDPLVRHAPGSEIMRCIHIALLCVQENVANRPTMNAIILMLNSNSLTLPVPLQPAFYMHSTIEADRALDLNSTAAESDHSKSKPTHDSENQASITELFSR